VSRRRKLQLLQRSRGRPGRPAKNAERFSTSAKAKLSLTILLAGWLLFELALFFTPFPHPLTQSPPESVEFQDRTGKPLRRVLVQERVYARRCRLSDISPNVIAATLSAEDKRFRQHRGVDWLATVRAITGGAALALPAGAPPLRGHVAGPSWSRKRGQHVARSGASTITQQLIKLADPGPRTFSRKLREIWLALRLERAWSKDRILEEYLNRLDYGNLQIGIASASSFYFGKPSADLSAAEAAFLAGLPKAPSRLDPHTRFPAAQARQQWVLKRMHANRWLTSAAYERACSEPLRLLPLENLFAAPHFVDLLLQRRGTLPASGGTVRTTLDLDLTQWIEQVITRQLTTLADKHVTTGAVVVIENATGDVLALCGSGDYFRPGVGQVNGAWIERSPGSAVKPFTYLCALERGTFPGTVVADVPSEFSTPTGLYRPNNYNHRFYGPVTLRFALGNSLNVAAVRTLELAGGPQVLFQALQDCGITTLGHPPEYYGLGLTLGNGEVRLLELTNAFATLARLGLYRPYRLLTSVRESSCRAPGPGAGSSEKDIVSGMPAPGPGALQKLSLTSSPKPKQVFDQRAAYLLADILSDNHARAATFGLNSYLSLDFPVACKTGTSSNYRDNWTIGYTPEWTVGVWVGNPNGSPMRGITGVTGAAPIFREVFVHLRKQYGTSWYTAPPSISRHLIDPLTGRRLPTEEWWRPAAPAQRFASQTTVAGPPDLRGAHVVGSGPLFDKLRANVPGEERPSPILSLIRQRAIEELSTNPIEPARPSDYDVGGRVCLTAEYAAWLDSPQNTLGDLATLAINGGNRFVGSGADKAAPSIVASTLRTSLRIVSPAQGSSYFLDPDLPLSSQRVTLVAESAGPVEWSSASLDCASDHTRMTATLRPGHHLINARDTRTGATASTWIEVRPW
jgi:penicillin-binding protein 1C